jgi:hypothetical protein
MQFRLHFSFCNSVIFVEGGGCISVFFCFAYNVHSYPVTLEKDVLLQFGLKRLNQYKIYVTTPQKGIFRFTFTLHSSSLFTYTYSVRTVPNSISLRKGLGLLFLKFFYYR